MTLSPKKKSANPQVCDIVIERISCESPLSAPSVSKGNFNILSPNLTKFVCPTAASVTGEELSEVALLVYIGDLAERFILNNECDSYLKNQ